uniref:Uncharacterized protein n=1 Tax=Utricularia reniformis TaxID=192314 RepID=A0A1Y0B1P3_9LAMI|nr:hypothetical protein AEK19_MT1076 [Utricularia reniformis]ART31298.1 hypothetical protein AEK19_MT1076 [Utricularia reniformis]
MVSFSCPINFFFSIAARLLCEKLREFLVQFLNLSRFIINISFLGFVLGNGDARSARFILCLCWVVSTSGRGKVCGSLFIKKSAASKTALLSFYLCISRGYR